jgi:hypothetical protein
MFKLFKKKNSPQYDALMAVENKYFKEFLKANNFKLFDKGDLDFVSTFRFHKNRDFELLLTNELGEIIECCVTTKYNTEAAWDIDIIYGLIQVQFNNMTVEELITKNIITSRMTFAEIKEFLTKWYPQIALLLKKENITETNNLLGYIHNFRGGYWRANKGHIDRMLKINGERQENIRSVLKPLFDFHDMVELKPSSPAHLQMLRKQLEYIGLPSYHICDLIAFYSVCDGNGADCFQFHAANDPVIFEWWQDDRQLWLGQRDMDLYRLAGNKFCIGSVGRDSLGNDYEFENMSGLLTKIINEYLENNAE